MEGENIVIEEIKADKDDIIIFTVNEIKIKIDKHSLIFHSKLFKETLAENNFENMNFTFEYSNAHIILFFSMLNMVTFFR